MMNLKCVKNEPDDPIVHVYREAPHGWDCIGWVEKHGTGCWSATAGIGKATAHGFKTRRDAVAYLEKFYNQAKTPEIRE